MSLDRATLRSELLQADHNGLGARGPELELGGAGVCGAGPRQDDEGGIRMLCRRCAAGGIRPGTLSPTAAWGAARIHGLLCTLCGAVLGAGDTAQPLVHKQWQLAQFGLVNLHRPLLKPIRLEDD